MNYLKVVNETKVILGPCRLSYTHVFKRYSPDGAGEGKYMTNILIPKVEKKAVDAINAAIDAARKAGIVSKWGGKEPRKIDLPLRDGDERDDDVYQGHYFLNAKCNTRPNVVDENREPIMDEEMIYSGVWAWVSVTFYAYDVNGNRGVACGLNNIMRAKDGERLGGRASAENDFKGINTEGMGDADHADEWI